MSHGGWEQAGQLVHKARGTGANHESEQLSASAEGCASPIIEGAKPGRQSSAVSELLALVSRIEGVGQVA